jgi:hypothetical protein
LEADCTAYSHFSAVLLMCINNKEDKRMDTVEVLHAGRENARASVDDTEGSGPSQSRCGGLPAVCGVFTPGPGLTCRYEPLSALSCAPV